MNENKKLSSTFIIDQQECSDPCIIANKFSDYFSKIGLKLSEKIPNVSIFHTSFLTGNYPNTMFLEPSSKQEVIDIISSIRNGVASGYDDLPIFAIKDNIDIIAILLTYCQPLSSGIFPNSLNISRGLPPVFKTGDCQLLSNYRPISILPIFSKVFETVVYNRLIKHMNLFYILFEN